ncbi:hypothetical protein MMC17_010079 [Xylographa soralifera]|nr:hypothetical protein [Xylographa soralifera]
MPPEIAINIFCQLPSFFDVFAFSAVCRQLRHLWLNSVKPIYNQIAPRSIPCERAARRFLVDQDGPDLGSPMSAKDIVRMVRNASVIEKAILDFERDIVSRVKMYGLEDQGFYGPGVWKHPPTLTSTERTRFICSYYTLWSLMRLDRSGWESRLQAMTQQELYYLQEMAELTQSIKREEIFPLGCDPDILSDQFDFMHVDQCEKGFALRLTVWEQIQRNSWCFFGLDAMHTTHCARYEGYFVFVVLWDHWQPTLKEVVLHSSRSLLSKLISSAIKEQYLWKNEFEEEI